MSAITSFAATGGAPTSGRGLGELTSAEFLNIMLNELSVQDPLAPNDTSTLIQQIADLRAIEADIRLGDRLDELVRQNELVTSANLIGAIVGGVSESNQRTAGTVLSISRTAEGSLLNLDNGQQMRLGQVDEIVQPSLLQDLFGPSLGGLDLPAQPPAAQPEDPPLDDDDDQPGEETP